MLNDKFSKKTCVMREIRASAIVSGLPYQRNVSMKGVTALVRNWDSRIMDPLVVSYRDGKYYLVNGQHRLSALRSIYGEADFMIPCKVYFGLTYEEEAELSVLLDRGQRKLSLAESLAALIESNSDADVTEILRIIEKHGFVWALDHNRPKEYHIKAARAVVNAYKLLGGDSFDRMMFFMSMAWNGDPASLTGNFISGMALFMKTYENELTDRVAIKRLSAIDPEEVLRKGKLDFSTNHAPLRYARVLLAKYNSHRGGGKLQYRFNA